MLCYCNIPDSSNQAEIEKICGEEHKKYLIHKNNLIDKFAKEQMYAGLIRRYSRAPRKTHQYKQVPFGKNRILC